MNLIPSLGGSYLFGHQIETSYFDQQLAQFSSGKTVLEELWDAAPDLDRTQVRSILGQFLFTADEVFKSVDVLSGGEKVRLSLAKLLLQHSNLLILDEPTNHLDIPGKEALEEALHDFSGTIIFVSHDRYFIQQLSTKMLLMQDGKATLIDESYASYMNGEDPSAKAEAARQQEAKQPADNEKVKGRKEVVMSPQLREQEIARLEKQITAKEQELEDNRALRFEPEYYQDAQKMEQLDEHIDDIHNELAHLYERWEKLNS